MRAPRACPFEAAELGSAASGLGRDADGRVWLRGPARIELHRWIDGKTPPGTSMEGLLDVPRADASAVAITVAPLPRTAATWLANGRRWLLVVVDPEREIRGSTQLVAKDLGIPPRASEIAALLVAGHDLGTIARKKNIDVSTVRSRLESIFAKTGVCSQVELVQRIRSGPALLGEPPR